MKMTSYLIAGLIGISSLVSYSDENPGKKQNKGERQGWQRKENEERSPMKKFMGRLSQEELESLRKMHEENPEEFRKEILKRMQERKAEIEERHSKSIELAKRYFETADPTEKERLKAEIKASIVEEFDERMKKNKERLERAEKQLQELRKNIEEREKNKEIIIEERYKELLKDPALRW